MGTSEQTDLWNEAIITPMELDKKSSYCNKTSGKLATQSTINRLEVIAIRGQDV